MRMRANLLHALLEVGEDRVQLFGVLLLPARLLEGAARLVRVLERLLLVLVALVDLKMFISIAE